MRYIKVLPESGLSSEQIAVAISRELFKIQRPIDQQGDATQFLFGWIKHPTQDAAYSDVVDTALVVDPAQVIYVHPDNDLSLLISLFPELTEQEKQMLAGFIRSQSQFPFQYIVPSTTKLFTEDEMKQSGWIQEVQL